MQRQGAFSGPVPEVYDRVLVPILFAPMAEDLAARVAKLDPGSVIEVAAGSGALTRVLLPRLGPGACYAATDLSQGMLDRAQAAVPDDPRLAFRVADAAALPYDDGSFEIAVAQFGVMLFPDRAAALREARRVLGPGGRLLFSVWDRIEANDFAQATEEAVARLWPGDPPRFLSRGPYGWHDPERIGAEARAAGFGEVRVEPVEAVTHAALPRDPAVGFVQGSPLRAEVEARDAGGLERATEAAAQEIGRRFGAGPVSGRMRAWVVEAVA